MPNLRTQILLTLMVFWFEINLNAQVSDFYPKFQFTNYSVDDGLSHNFIMSIYQDNKGFMWFGSLNGIDRFDGSSFKHYNRNDKDSTAITGDFVNFIFEDSKGKTWIGTENGGLHLFNKEKESFKLIYEQDSLNNKKRFFANSIAEDKEGNLWIGTFSGLKKYNRATGTYITYTSNPNDTASICNNEILKIHCDSSDRIWIGTKKGMDILSADRKVFNHIPLYGSRPTDSEVIEFMEDTNNIMWIGTFSHGLIKYNTKNNSYKVILINPLDDYSNTVRKLVKDDKGNIWIGGRNGIFIYNPKENSFIHLPHDESFKLGIPHNSILEMYKDKTGDIWLGTRYGVSHWNTQKQAFQYYHSEKNDNRCLNSSSVFSFLQSKDKIYIATESGGINVLNTDNTFSYLKSPLLNTDNIKCICEAEDGTLWIGTFMGGINVYDPKLNTIKYYLKNQKQNTEHTLSDDRVNVIIKDYKNNLWIGTGNGLSRYNKKGNNFDNFPQFTTRQINWIKEIDRVLWFGTADSLFQLNIENDAILLKKEMNFVTRSVFKDNKGLIRIATVGNGLLTYAYDTIVSSITTQNGLSSNLTYGILEDNDNNLWISTSNGLNRYTPETNDIKTFFKDDGTQLNQYNYNSFYKLKSGEMLFGGNNGFVRFNPQNIKDINRAYKIQITDFYLFGKKLELNNDSSSILKKSVIYSDTIVLNYDQNFFTIHFALLNFTNHNRNKYKYKLNGLDKEWVNAGGLNHATYTNVNPGQYNFEVQGSDGNSENTTYDQLCIIINPPFYKTPFFISACILLGIALFLIIIRWRNLANIKKNKKLQFLIDAKTKHLEINRIEILEQNEEIETQNEQLLKLSEYVQEQNRELEQQAAGLEKMVEERTCELENAKAKAEESDRLKTIFLANMSHEIRTPMNGILGFTDLLKDPEINKEDQISYVNIIEESGMRMLNIINDLIDISKIESNQIDLNTEEVNADEIIEYLFNFFNHNIIKKNITFKKEVAYTQQPTLFYTDKTKLVQILTNLINNAIKFTNNGFIGIGYKTHHNYIEWRISDSGIGIDPAIQSKVFERFIQGDSSITKKYEGAGLGLYISKQFVEIMDGEIILESEVNKGTTFIIRLPLNKESSRLKVSG